MKKLLAAILALVMALSLCSVSWADGEVAEINGVQYKTLEAAFAAAQNGDTVKVLQDTVVKSQIAVGKWASEKPQEPAVIITLDLAGRTVTVESYYGFFVQTNGRLVVEDSATGGVIKNAAGNNTLIQVNNGSLEVRGGTLEGTDVKSGHVVFVNGVGDATISGGKIKATTTYNAAVYANNDAAFVKITGGEIESDGIAVYAAFTPVTVTAGTVKGGTYAFQTRNTTIEPADGAAIKVEASNAAFYTFSDSKNVVKGGSIEAPAVTKTYTGEDNGLSVTGGTLSADVSDYVPANTPAATVVKDGETTYAVGSAAIADAANNDANVTIIKGGAVSGVNEGVTIVVDKKVEGVTINNVPVEEDQTYTVPAKPSSGGYYYAGPSITAVLNGPNKSATDYTSGDYGLIFRSTASYSSFTGVQVDGKTLAKSNYTAEANGSGTEVYLKAAYLKTLAAGKHTVTILSTAGNVSMDFTIGGKTTAPQTFDAGIALYVGMALTSAAGVAFVAKKRQD